MNRGNYQFVALTKMQQIGSFLNTYIHSIFALKNKSGLYSNIIPNYLFSFTFEIDANKYSSFNHSRHFTFILLRIYMTNVCV